MNESSFNSILVKSFRNLGWHCQKIPDCPFKGNGSRFIPLRPYDMLAYSDDYSLSIEGKVVKPKTKAKYCSFNFNKIESHQLGNLIDANKKKRSMGLLALYVWRKNEIKEVNIIPIKIVLDFMENCEYGFSREFIENYPMKYNCHDDLFALPINLDKQLFEQA